jgi:hypothetical protein
MILILPQRTERPTISAAPYAGRVFFLRGQGFRQQSSERSMCAPRARKRELMFS